MLKTTCIHPEIMQALALCGHGDKIVITDGNYPLDSRTGDAKKVYLGLTKGVPEVTQVLRTLCDTICIERAEIIVPADGSRPEIFSEFSQILNNMPLEALGRYEFYAAACAGDVRLAISTGEKRTYACILLTVGVV